MESVNIRELNERIQKESSFVDLLTLEMGKVIVGQKQLIDNLLIGLLSGGHSAESCVHLLVANQDSDLVTALRFDRRTEKLSLLHMKMQAVKPTCILPV
jgi:hypothetical protein